MALKTATCVMSATSKLTCFPREIPATVSYPDRTPDAPVVVYDTDMNRVALLPYAFNIGYEKKINQVWNATFYLPYDDPHASECSLLRFVEIYDGSVRVGLFRITDRKVRHIATRKVWWYQCEHVLATLNDSMLVDVHNAGSSDYTEGAINHVLSYQDPVRWKLGQCDWSRSFLYRWENVTLLEALFEIPKRFGEDYQWTFDTNSYPWTINLVAPSTTVTAYIDYSRNLEEITREEDARELYTRLWAYGQGAQGSTTQVSIRDVNPTGMDYIDADTIDTYGVIERVWVDQRYTDSQSLYDAAVERLELRKTPIYRYTIQAADIYRLTGEEIDKFELGAYVRVDDEELGIETSDRVVAISKPDLQGRPGDVTIQLANKLREFTDLTDIVYSPTLDDVVDGGAFARVLSTSIEAGVIKLSAIPGGTVGALPSTPSVAGLYLGASYLGYHNGSSWKTYMDINGRFKLVGTDSYLEWDPTGTGSLTVKGTVYLSSNSTLPALFVTTAMIDDLAVTTAKIDNLAVTDAKIDTLSVGKLTSGTIDSQTITLGGDNCWIAAGKASYVDTTAGFFLGLLGTTPVFNIGDATRWMKWTGSVLQIKGGIDTSVEEAFSKVTAASLYIDGSVIFDADGVYHNITGISDLRGPVWGVSTYGSITFATSGTTAMTIEHSQSGDSITLNSYDGTEYGLRLYAPNGQIRFLTLDAGSTALAFENWTSSGNASTYTDQGWIKVRIGGVIRYIRLFNSAT